MRKTALSAGLFSITAIFGQTRVDFSGQDFFTLRDQLRTRFDDLIQADDPHAFIEGGDYSEFKQWEDFWAPRLKQGDTFEDYYRSYALCMEQLPQYRSQGNVDTWDEVGPIDRPHYGANDIGQGAQPGIGPIRGITVNAGDPDKMLCWSWSGGVYYTDNAGDPAGANWRNGGSDSWYRCGCHSAVFNINDANTWYAVNDDFWGYSGGIWRTFDAGTSWERIADQTNFYAGGIWSRVNKLIPDPANPNRLFAAADHRLWVSNDVNAVEPTWTDVFIPMAPTVANDPAYSTYQFQDSRRVYDLEVMPGDPQVMVASVEYDGTLDISHKVRYWMLMRSTDGGGTWSEMPNQPTQSFQDHTYWINNHTVEVHEYNNASNLTMETSTATPDRLYVYYDRGTTQSQLWRATNVTNATWDGTAISSSLGTLYGGGNGFGISQLNGEDVYIGRDHSPSPLHGPGRYLARVSGSWINYATGTLGTANRLQYHVDIEDFVCVPRNGVEEIWMANHGGVHRSLDQGATWEWRGSGLGVAEPYRMGSSYSEEGYVAMGLYHDATVLTNGDYAQPWEPDWRQLGGADGQKAMIDAHEGNWMYWNSQGNSWRKSGDHGSSTGSMYINNGNDYYPGGWDSEGALGRGSPASVFVAAYFHDPNPNQLDPIDHAEEVMRSHDHGLTFEPISNFEAIYGGGEKHIWRIYPSWSDPNTVYVHFDSGQRLFRTNMADGPAAQVMNNWQEIAPPLPGAWIADLDFDFDDPNIVYVSYSSSAMGSNNAEGQQMLYRVDYTDALNPVATDLTGSLNTWTPLPNTGAGWENLALERGTDGGIYFATDIGVYYTNNKLMTDGSGWQRLGTGLPPTQCKGLEINYKANRIRAGLVGRGLWEHDLWCPDQESAFETGTYASDAFIEVLQDVSSTAIVPAATTVNYRGGTQVHMTPDFHASAGCRFHAFIHPCDHDGNSFRSFTPAPSVMEEQREESGPPGTSRSTEHPYPDPTSGEFLWLKDTQRAAKNVVALDPSGREVKIEFMDQGDRLQLRLAKENADGLYVLMVTYKDGTWERTSVCLAR